MKNPPAPLPSPRRLLCSPSKAELRPGTAATVPSSAQSTQAVIPHRTTLAVSKSPFPVQLEDWAERDSSCLAAMLWEGGKKSTTSPECSGELEGASTAPRSAAPSGPELDFKFIRFQL